MKYFLSVILATFLLSASCSKTTNTADLPPSNLQVTATVRPDNSGNVDFVAAATNATTYQFEFGNGQSATEASGKTTYRYPESGNYTARITAKSATGKSTVETVNVSVTVERKLVWSDEFNTPGAPDPSKWAYDIGTGSDGWGNQELQYYTSRPENVVIADDMLRITVRKENYSGREWTSARIKTQGKYSVKYGKIEMRAKLPSGKGSWPAFWMLGDNINTVGWPASGEIDIMEHVGNDQNRVHGTLHFPGNSGGNAVGKQITVPTASTEFHLYSVEWNESVIKFAVDGTVFHEFANRPDLPFHQPFFIILNFAVGGGFGGAVDPSFNGDVYLVDYVRVYQ